MDVQARQHLLIEFGQELLELLGPAATSRAANRVVPAHT
jgi:hypothetical protein